MFIKVLFIVFLLNRNLLSYLVLPMVTLAAIGFLSASLTWHHNNHHTGKINLKTPLSLVPALKFGVFYSLIMLISKVGMHYFGAKGLYLVSLISGFADIDAITIFVAHQGMSINPVIATITIVIWCQCKHLFKNNHCQRVGFRQVQKNITLVLGLIVFVGLLFAMYLGKL